MLNNSTGPILIIIAALLWALDGLIRQHLYSLPPITVIFFEHIFGLILLLPFVYKSLAKHIFTRRDWILLVVVSFFSGFLGTMWFTAALAKVNYISLSVVFLLQKLQPIFAISTATIFLKEKFEKGYLGWAALALVSAYFVTFPNGIVNLSTGEGTAIAALYALGAAFAWGSSTTFSKMLLTNIPSKISTFYRFLFTALMTLPILFLFGYGSSLTAPTRSQFGLFAVIALSTGMVALLIYYKGLRRTPVHISTILELTFPFIAILIDMKVNHTELALSQWGSAFILVYAIYRITLLRSQK